MFRSYKSVTNGKFSYTLVLTKNVLCEIFDFEAFESKKILKFHAIKEKYALAGQNFHLFTHHYI